jgi:hypothetical protein
MFTHLKGKTLRHRFHIYPQPGAMSLRDRVAVADQAERWCEERMGQENEGHYGRITPVAFEIETDEHAMEFRLRWC